MPERMLDGTRAHLIKVSIVEVYVIVWQATDTFI